jgi:competence protein ComEC
VCLGAIVSIPFCLKKSRLLVIVVAILIGATAMSIRQASLEKSEIAQHVNTTIKFTAQAVTDPSKTSTGKYSLIARLLNFEQDGKSYFLRVPVRVITKNTLDILPGQKINGNARVVKSSESRVAALLLIDREVQVITEPSMWAKALGSIRSGLQKSFRRR